MQVGCLLLLSSALSPPAPRLPKAQYVFHPIDAPASFGGDPRRAVTVAAEFWAAPEPGRVGRIGSAGELQAVIEATSPGALTVIKFESQHCAACQRTQPMFARAARAGARAGSRFCTVDAFENQLFCKEQVGIRSVPCAHVYRDGSLLALLAIGKISEAAFRTTLRELDLSGGSGQGRLARTWRRLRSGSPVTAADDI